MIREGIKPDLTLLTKIYIEKINDKEILIINVSDGLSKPYYLTDKGMKSSGVFVRHGISSSPTTDENIRKMLANQDLNLDYTYQLFSKKNIEIDKSKEKTLNIVNFDNL